MGITPFDSRERVDGPITYRPIVTRAIHAVELAKWDADAYEANYDHVERSARARKAWSTRRRREREAA